MGVSITQRPASFSPVNNPVVYKFSTTGGPYTNYRIEIEVFAGGVSVGSIFSFTPNSSNVTTADISAILRSILYREWSTTASEDGIGSTEFYIKYQELYTGSATSQTSDSANTKVGVLSGLQIGASADLTDYVLGSTSKLLLTKFDVLKYWNDYPFSVSFLNPEEGSTYILQSYDISNSLIGTASGNIASTHNGLNRYVLNEADIFSNAIKLFLQIGYRIEFPPDYSNWTDVGSAFTKTSSQLSVTNMVLGTTYTARHSITTVASGAVPNNVTLGTTATVDGGTITITVRYRNSNTATVVSTNSQVISVSGFANKTFTFSAITQDADQIEVLATTNYLPGTNDIIIGSGSGNMIFNISNVSETKEIIIQSACKNPVYLFWKNSLGGDSFYMFYYGQEDYFTYDNGRKAKRQVLYAENLSYNEWETINELNTPGERYQVAIPELTTSVNKTGKRTDQQVYVIDTDGNKTGVIVIPRSVSARTNKKIHSISVEIEYPTIFL